MHRHRVMRPVANMPTKPSQCSTSLRSFLASGSSTPGLAANQMSLRSPPNVVRRDKMGYFWQPLTTPFVPARSPNPLYVYSVLDRFDAISSAPNHRFRRFSHVICIHCLYITLQRTQQIWAHTIRILPNTSPNAHKQVACAFCSNSGRVGREVCGLAGRALEF